jgi:hypothetical protein
MDLTSLNKFHHWFHKGISHWLCISQYKAMCGIQKAVQMDKIVPDYTDTKYSSSAYDMLQLFDQVTMNCYSNWGYYKEWHKKTSL